MVPEVLANAFRRGGSGRPGPASLGNPTAPAWYTRDSGVLTDGQTYKFAVRIATDIVSASIETQSTDDYSATVNSDVPTAPVLNAQIV